MSSRARYSTLDSRRSRAGGWHSSNVTGALLDSIDTLVPPGDVVLELLETIEVTPELIEACRRLEASGYLLALDDFVPGSAAEALIPFVSFVKVDVLTTPLEDAAVLAERLRPTGVTMLAETTSAPWISKPWSRRTSRSACACCGSSTPPLPDQDGGQYDSPGAVSHRHGAIRKWASVWCLAGLNTGATPELSTLALVRAREPSALSHGDRGAPGPAEHRPSRPRRRDRLRKWRVG